MRELRDAARQLDERQQQLSQQLDEVNSERRSLRDAGPREELMSGLAEQRRQLAETLEKMRDTVTEAEEPEPLLARQLYDAVQQAATNRTEEALDAAQQLDRGGRGERSRRADAAGWPRHRAASRARSTRRPKACWATRPKRCGGLMSGCRRWRKRSTARFKMLRAASSKGRSKASNRDPKVGSSKVAGG